MSSARQVNEGLNVKVAPKALSYILVLGVVYIGI